MNYVIENKNGLYYGGFLEGQPVWYKTKRKETKFDSKIADTIFRQLTALGFSGIEKNLADGAHK